MEAFNPINGVPSLTPEFGKDLAWKVGQYAYGQVNGAGLFSAPRIGKTWSLTWMDTDPSASTGFGLSMYDAVKHSIQGQFAPEEFTENESAGWSNLSLPGKQFAVPQWNGGSEATCTFTARFWATHDGISLGDLVDKMRLLTRRVPALGRPPECYFEWAIDGERSGADFVFVTSVGGIKYDSVTNDGNLRGVTFQVTLRRLDDSMFDFKLTTSDDLLATQKRNLAFGDKSTFETIAKKTGKRLGRKAFPKAGERATLRARGYIPNAQERATMESLLYDPTNDAKALTSSPPLQALNKVDIYPGYGIPGGVLRPINPDISGTKPNLNTFMQYDNEP